MRSTIPITVMMMAVTVPIPAAAASITYGCDTAAGRFSAIELEVPSTGFEVSGSITPNEFRKDKTWAASAWVRIDAVDEQNAAEVRFTGVSPSKDGLITLSGKSEGSERKGDPQLGKIAAPFAFSIKVVSPAEVLLMAGNQKAKLLVTMGDKVKLTIGCSTGDFVFSNLEWKPVP